MPGWLIVTIIFLGIATILFIDRWLRQRKSLSARYWYIPGESVRLYRLLVVRVYKKYMPTSGDWMLNHVWFPKGWTRRGDFWYAPSREQGMMSIIASTKLLERVHLFLLALWVVGTAYGLVADHSLRSILWFVGSWLVVNVPTNIYPIFVQRYNRLRALMVLVRLQKRHSSSVSAGA